MRRAAAKPAPPFLFGTSRRKRAEERAGRAGRGEGSEVTPVSAPRRPGVPRRGPSQALPPSHRERQLPMGSTPAQPAEPRHLPARHGRSPGTAPHGGEPSTGRGTGDHSGCFEHGQACKHYTLSCFKAMYVTKENGKILFFFPF